MTVPMSGYNYYGAEVHQQLKRLSGSEERGAYILMDRVRPPVQQSFLLRHEAASLAPVASISELGVYGVYVR